jgi:hypothetical protein
MAISAVDHFYADRRSCLPGQVQGEKSSRQPCAYNCDLSHRTSSAPVLCSARPALLATARYGKLQSRPSVSNFPESCSLSDRGWLTIIGAGTSSGARSFTPVLPGIETQADWDVHLARIQASLVPRNYFGRTTFLQSVSFLKSSGVGVADFLVHCIINF